MRYLKKIAGVFCGAALGILALTACEGADLYNNDSPDWISEKIDSINAAKAGQNKGIELPADMHEDVYSFGSTDFTSGWWSAFSKYYVIPDGKKWYAQFNLNINPSDNTYYKNFALVITNDAPRGAAGYTEYGAFRYDATNDSATYNSQWGSDLFFKYTTSNAPMSPTNNKDAGLQKLGGKVTLIVDRSNPDSFKIEINNGTVIKKYSQPYALRNLNADATNKNIRCFLAVEGSYIDFLSSNVRPEGGYTSAKDKQPVSMTLNNVPDEVALGTPLDTAMQNVTATVTYEEGVTATIPASQLYFVSTPDMSSEGEKHLVVVYDKTFKGVAADKPISATAKFMVRQLPTSIEVTHQPAHTHYYYFSSDATSDLTSRTLALDKEGLVVTGTYPNGSKAVIDNAKLTFSEIPAKVGKHTVTVSSSNGKTARIEIEVSQSKSTFATPDPTTLGAEDNSTVWWGAHLNSNVEVPAGETREFSFTNYTTGVSNWNNFVVDLVNVAKGHSADDAAGYKEYAVVRSDNYGWGDGYAASTHTASAAADWASWLTEMNGAKVKVYVTNCNNGTADIQAVMTGSLGSAYTLYYLGLNTIDPKALYVDFTVDNCHLVFDKTASAKRHVAHRTYRSLRR